MVAMPAPADVWHDATIQEPGYLYLTWRTEILPRTVRPTYQRAPGIQGDLRAQPDTPQQLAAWAGSMMGGDASDMLDI